MTFTAVIKRSDAGWIGWIQEVPALTARSRLVRSSSIRSPAECLGRDSDRSQQK